MTTHRIDANHSTAAAFVAALDPLGFEKLEKLHTVDVVYDVLGTTPLSGRHTGHAAVIQQFFEPLCDAFAPDAFSLAVESVIACADEKGAVTLARAQGVAKGGRTFDQVVLYALTIADGAITKVEVAWDTALVSEAIYGDQLSQPREPRNVQLPADLGISKPGTNAVDVTRAYYTAMSTADWETFPKLHSPNVVFDLPGSLPVSGHFEGFENCIGGVVAPWVSTFDPEHPPGVSHYRFVCADDRRAVAFMRAAGRTPAGVEADVIMVQIFTVENGQIVHLNEHLDTAYLEAVCWGNELRDRPVTGSGGIDTHP